MRLKPVVWVGLIVSLLMMTSSSFIRLFVVLEVITASTTPEPTSAAGDTRVPIPTSSPLPTESLHWSNELSCKARPHREEQRIVQSCSVPILTMFTTMQESDGSRKKIHNNTIINWSLLGSCVQLILYLDETETELAQFARDNRWRVEEIPHSAHDIPVLSSMFLTSFNLESTPLYLYANSDILFDFSLVNTIRALLCALQILQNTEQNITESNEAGKFSKIHRGIFAVGRRTNVNLTDILSPNPEVLQSIESQGELFGVDALDYFITTPDPGFSIGTYSSTSDAVKNTTKEDCLTGKQWTHKCNIEKYQLDKYNSRRNKRHSSDTKLSTNVFSNPHAVTDGHFPWRLVSDFVIGRAGYDNWLVAQAVRWNVSVAVDLTNTVLAIHQTGKDGTHSGIYARSHVKTACVNFALVEKNFLYFLGRTSCLGWLSQYSMDDSIAFVPRDEHDPICNGKEEFKRRSQAAMQTGEPKVKRPCWKYLVYN